MDDFYERIDPSAFSLVSERRGRKSPLETRALFNHDPNHVLGRYPTTLRMKVDEMGLRYEIKMPESRRDLMESIERGDIRGSSFSFVVSPGGEEWSAEEGRSIRTVKSIASLIDVGPVTFPAYPDASVAVARRSYDEFMRGQQARRSELDAIRGHRAEIQKFLRERGR
jgi:HK97 family phage prohead protease